MTNLQILFWKRDEPLDDLIRQNASYKHFENKSSFLIKNGDLFYLISFALSRL